jgi:hypothetical protein
VTNEIAEGTEKALANRKRIVSMLWRMLKSQPSHLDQSTSTALPKRDR